MRVDLANQVSLVADSWPIGSVAKSSLLLRKATELLTDLD